ncbi:MAG: hypothetical protein ABSH16_01335 [Sedimentisphaerales bacterium]
MQIRCPNCQSIFDAPDMYIGKKVKCLKCNYPFIANKPEDNQQGTQGKDTRIFALKSKTTTMPSSDVFLQFVFGFAKVISIIIVAFCFVSLIVCIIALFSVHPKEVQVPIGLSVPSFSENLKQINTQISQQISKNSSEDSRKPDSLGQSTEIVYKINDLCKKYGLLNRDTLLNWVSELNVQHRTIFLNGLEKYLSDAEEYSRNYKAPFDCAFCAISYHKDFLNAVQAYDNNVESSLIYNKLEKEKANTIRKLILIAIACSLGFLLAFLILPLLIQIERNTRVILTNKQHSN